MRGNRNADVCDIMERANQLISCISGAVLALKNAQDFAGFEQLQDALTMLAAAENLIVGTDRELRELERKIAQFRDNTEDAMLAAQSLETDGDAE